MRRRLEINVLRQKTQLAALRGLSLPFYRTKEYSRVFYCFRRVQTPQQNTILHDDITKASSRTNRSVMHYHPSRPVTVDHSICLSSNSEG